MIDFMRTLMWKKGPEGSLRPHIYTYVAIRTVAYRLIPIGHCWLNGRLSLCLSLSLSLSALSLSLSLGMEGDPYLFQA